MSVNVALDRLKNLYFTLVYNEDKTLQILFFRSKLQFLYVPK